MKYFCTALIKQEVYDTQIWETFIWRVLDKKWPKTVNGWVSLWKILHFLREQEVEQKANINLEKQFEKILKNYKEDPDKQWHYDLEKGQFRSVEEMINRDQDSDSW